jgi:transposase
MSTDHDDDGSGLPKRRRRSWTLEEKRRIVSESHDDGASIAEVARRHDVNANQLFTWRRQFGIEPAAKEIGPILPVAITPNATAEYSDRGSNGQMEVVLCGGDRIIVWADVDPAALSRVLEALSRR